MCDFTASSSVPTHGLPPPLSSSSYVPCFDRESQLLSGSSISSPPSGFSPPLASSFPLPPPAIGRQAPPLVSCNSLLHDTLLSVSQAVETDMFEPLVGRALKCSRSGRRKSASVMRQIPASSIHTEGISSYSMEFIPGSAPSTDNLTGIIGQISASGWPLEKDASSVFVPGANAARAKQLCSMGSVPEEVYQQSGFGFSGFQARNEILSPIEQGSPAEYSWKKRKLRAESDVGVPRPVIMKAMPQMIRQRPSSLQSTAQSANVK